MAFPTRRRSSCFPPSARRSSDPTKNSRPGKLVRTDADPELLLCMLLGAILYRVVLSLNIGNRELDQLSTLILAAVQPVGRAT